VQDSLIAPGRVRRPTDSSTVVERQGYARSGSSNRSPRLQGPTAEMPPRVARRTMRLQPIRQPAVLNSSFQITNSSVPRWAHFNQLSTARSITPNPPRPGISHSSMRMSPVRPGICMTRACAERHDTAVGTRDERRYHETSACRRRDIQCCEEEVWRAHS
jgi:hypothetical protein